MGTKRVLIADDDSTIRVAIQRSLQSSGYLVDEAADGRETLAAIDRGRPDVLLLDLKMPVLDGMGVLNELLEMRPEKKPRVIVMSGFGSISVAVQATRLGAMAFLEKPVTAAEIRRSILDVLAEPLPVVPSRSHEPDLFAGGYDAVLDRIRHALRQVNYPLAETLLMRVEDLAEKDAAYFNLLGIYYELKRHWRSARKFFSKAVAADARYQPAQQNMKRLNDLAALRQAVEPIAYGDEPDLTPAVPESPQSKDLPPVTSPR